MVKRPQRFSGTGTTLRLARGHTWCLEIPAAREAIPEGGKCYGQL